MNVIDQASGENWIAYNGDTIEVSKGLPDASADFSVFSPPFASLYTYSNSPRDLGNCRSHAEFFEHYAHLVDQQRRVMKPGRLVAIHCMQLPTSKERDGYIGLSDFRGELIRAYQRAGFIYHSEVCIWKNPVTAMQRSKALGLLHKTIRKDSSMSRQGIADYLVVMRTPGANPDPIAHDLTSFPIERWQRYASPVWASLGEPDDEGFYVCGDNETPGNDASGIDQGDTLNARVAREQQDERHLCCLQIGVIRRAIRLWSNPGDVVWSPFGGVGSEGYVALQEGRRAVLAELKRSYFLQAIKNLASVEVGTKKQVDLFSSTGT